MSNSVKLVKVKRGMQGEPLNGFKAPPEQNIKSKIIDNILVSARTAINPEGEEEMFICWEWQKSKFKHRGGYGKIAVGKEPKPAHIVSYEQFIGPRTPGLVIMHRCNNSCCVNPAHLQEGTRKENARHAAIANLLSRKPGLNQDIVREIRTLGANGMRQKDIIKHVQDTYAIKISQGYASKLVRGECRAH